MQAVYAYFGIRSYKSACTDWRHPTSEEMSSFFPGKWIVCINIKYLHIPSTSFFSDCNSLSFSVIWGEEWIVWAGKQPLIVSANWTLSFFSSSISLLSDWISLNGFSSTRTSDDGSLWEETQQQKPNQSHRCRRSFHCFVSSLVARKKRRLCVRGQNVWMTTHLYFVETNRIW